MPYLMIQTNISVDPENRAEFLKAASGTVAEALGKPESYVMVALRDDTPMLFAGSDAPLAYLELKSLGLPEEKTADFSHTLCQFIHARLGIDLDRIYIEFASPARHMFGWNGRTF